MESWVSRESILRWSIGEVLLEQWLVVSGRQRDLLGSLKASLLRDMPDV